jgi:hypothetical protein
LGKKIAENFSIAKLLMRTFYFEISRYLGFRESRLLKIRSLFLKIVKFLVFLKSKFSEILRYKDFKNQGFEGTSYQYFRASGFQGFNESSI